LPEQEDPRSLLPWKGMMLQHRTTTAIDPTWNAIAARINAFPYPTSDQCSEKHYQDVFEFLRINRNIVDRVFECGVFHGGMSVLLAGCALAFDFYLDLIDVNPAALQSTFHRIRRTFPEALPKVRIFLGEIPNYVKTVMQDSEFKNAILHHDGSHRFNTVVNDLPRFTLFARMFTPSLFRIHICGIRIRRTIALSTQPSLRSLELTQDISR
jgi:hypothetical protein